MTVKCRWSSVAISVSPRRSAMAATAASTMPGHAAQIAASTALWVVLPLALGLLRTLRREVG
jgi:hypothetical protein